MSYSDWSPADMNSDFGMPPMVSMLPAVMDPGGPVASMRCSRDGAVSPSSGAVPSTHTVSALRVPSTSLEAGSEPADRHGVDCRRRQIGIGRCAGRALGELHPSAL